jgi:aryl-alcohol dehydrogenase-like predicted oxidoreductase
VIRHDNDLVTGQATPKGTERYVSRVAERVVAEHFRPVAPGLHASTIGLGTYLGREDDATDALYQAAVTRALERGINVFDTAVNYRHQRSERAIGKALKAAIARDLVSREEVIVASKGGFIPFDTIFPPDPTTYLTEIYLRPGIIDPDQVVANAHCMTPRFLADQIDRSRKNLGVETIDVYYLHNPETQLQDVDHATFVTRLREAFSALEAAVRSGKIARYGAATWNAFRVDPGRPGYLSLAEMVGVARDVGGVDHHFRVVQLPYNLGMTEAFTRANQQVGSETVTALEAARRLDLYVMASAAVHQGQLTRNLPAVLAEFLPGLETDAQRALQFVRSTPGIGTALVGMKTVAHVHENAGVGAVAPLPWDNFKRMFSEA